jgi:hypothetical protein
MLNLLLRPYGAASGGLDCEYGRRVHRLGVAGASCAMRLCASWSYNTIQRHAHALMIGGGALRKNVCLERPIRGSVLAQLALRPRFP